MAPQDALWNKNILLIIGGGIAAYKALDLIRRLREKGAHIQVILTPAAQKFISALTVGALAHGGVYTELFAKNGHHDVSHIRLARQADLILVAPATASRMAKLAHGLAEDLAGAVLLAARCPILLAPAMNPTMWAHPATQRNRHFLQEAGCFFIGPSWGEMAEAGEAGEGRMSEVATIVEKTSLLLNTKDKILPVGPLSDKHFIVTSGPTQEPIDAVRYISNYSSGKQGHAIAAALAQLGARVTLISGPVTLQDPPLVHTRHVETGQEMFEAVEAALPADGAVFVAAVTDWRCRSQSAHKIKKDPSQPSFDLPLIENTDILASIAQRKAQRPKLVIGFAAETHNHLAYAQEKLRKKGADFILCNHVGRDTQGVFGSDETQITLVGPKEKEEWPPMKKTAVAEKLALYIARHFNPC